MCGVRARLPFEYGGFQEKHRPMEPYLSRRSRDRRRNAELDEGARGPWVQRCCDSENLGWKLTSAVRRNPELTSVPGEGTGLRQHRATLEDLLLERVFIH